LQDRTVRQRRDLTVCSDPASVLALDVDGSARPARHERRPGTNAVADERGHRAASGVSDGASRARSEVRLHDAEHRSRVYLAADGLLAWTLPSGNGTAGAVSTALCKRAAHAAEAHHD